MRRPGERMSAASRPLRVSFIARYPSWESTGILRSMLLGLHELGCCVQEINLWGEQRAIRNPLRRTGGYGPVFVRFPMVRSRLVDFGPDVILLVAGGLTFTAEDMTEARRLCPVVGMTLSDPDVYPTVSEYADRFDHHTTNSQQARQWYQERSQDSTTSLMPFAVDARFFVPRAPREAYRTEVAVVGHARPDRLELACRLRDEFGARIYGRNWPWPDTNPVYGEDWFGAVWSARCLVNFPRTGAGYRNVKVGVFEAVATGRLLFTEHLPEMESYFRYGQEIVSYADADDLTAKLRFYLDRPDLAAQIAQAGQLRCARDHTWSRRWAELFERLALRPPARAASSRLDPEGYH